MKKPTQKELKQNRYQQYQRALDAAYAAAKKAMAGMVEDTLSFNCGFAWAVVEDRAFAGWCRKQADALDRKDPKRHLYGTKHWSKGWCFWSPGSAPVQQVDIHVIGARAFAASLTLSLGIQCDIGSRLD